MNHESALEFVNGLFFYHFAVSPFHVVDLDSHEAGCTRGQSHGQMRLDDEGL